MEVLPICKAPIITVGALVGNPSLRLNINADFYVESEGIAGILPPAHQGNTADNEMESF